MTAPLSAESPAPGILTKASAKVKSVPVWGFHGDKDEAVPVQRSIDMVDALKKVDGNIKFTVYPGVKHDSWTRTFDNPELYAWLLKQTKQGGK